MTVDIQLRKIDSAHAYYSEVSQQISQYGTCTVYHATHRETSCRRECQVYGASHVLARAWLSGGRYAHSIQHASCIQHVADINLSVGHKGVDKTN